MSLLRLVEAAAEGVERPLRLIRFELARPAGYRGRGSPAAMARAQALLRRQCSRVATRSTSAGKPLSTSVRPEASRSVARVPSDRDN